MEESAISLEDLVKKLHEVFASDHVNIEEVKELMSSYKSRPQDLAKYSNYDPFRYTRNLVDEGNGKFNLIVLCWSEGQGSSIHDHANAHCFMKVMEGDLKETLFAWPESGEEEKPLEVKNINNYKKDEVTYISDEIGLHRVENTSHSNVAASLHLYSPPFKACQTFDERTGHTRKCKVTFWSKYGVRTPYMPKINKELGQ